MNSYCLHLGVWHWLRQLNHDEASRTEKFHAAGRGVCTWPSARQEGFVYRQLVQHEMFMKLALAMNAQDTPEDTFLSSPSWNEA